MVRSWGQPGRLLTLLSFAERDDEHWCYLSERVASDYMGGNHRNVARTFGRLVDLRVVEVLPAAGSRPTGYRVQGALGRWRLSAVRRGVGWSVPVDHAQHLLHDAGLLVAYRKTSGTAVVPSSRGRQKRFVVPSSGRLHEDFVVPSPRGRHKDFLVPSSRGRHEPFSSAVTQMKAQTHLSLRPSTETPDLSKREVERERETIDPDEERRRTYVDLVVAAIYRRTGAACSTGLRARLGALVGSVPLEHAERCVEGVPDHLRPPMIVTTLEHLANAPVVGSARQRRAPRERIVVNAFRHDDRTSRQVEATDDEHAARLEAGFVDEGYDIEDRTTVLR